MILFSSLLWVGACDVTEDLVIPVIKVSRVLRRQQQQGTLAPRNLWGNVHCCMAGIVTENEGKTSVFAGSKEIT